MLSSVTSVTAPEELTAVQLYRTATVPLCGTSFLSSVEVLKSMMSEYRVFRRNSRHKRGGKEIIKG